MDKPAKIIFDFLQESSGSFFRDIVLGTGIANQQVGNGLSTLVGIGLATCDDYSSFLSNLSSENSQANSDHHFGSAIEDLPVKRFRSRDRPSRSIIKQRVQTVRE